MYSKLSKQSKARAISVCENVLQLNASSGQVAKTAQAETTWPVIEAGEGAGMSLPEYLIHKPYEFLCKFYRLAGRLDEDLSPFEIAAVSLVWDLSFIRLPRRYQGKYLAAHAYGRPRSFHVQFLSEEEAYRYYRVLGYKPFDVMISPWVDFVTAFRLNVSVRDLETTFDYVLTEIDGRSPRSWDREKCEQFFSSRHNFAGYSGRTLNFWDR
jgi:hypothetical protein